MHILLPPPKINPDTHQLSHLHTYTSYTPESRWSTAALKWYRNTADLMHPVREGKKSHAVQHRSHAVQRRSHAVQHSATQVTCSSTQVTCSSTQVTCSFNAGRMQYNTGQGVATRMHCMYLQVCTNSVTVPQTINHW